jgi:hypothetical protein
MVLARWKMTLVATLAWAGLALGQAPAPPPNLGIGSDLLTVREAGRPDQKCRILKTWKQPDGAMAFEVQCLETEEHLTLVEMAPSEGGVADSSKGMKSRIYHWGQSVTPPPGVPQMPSAPTSSAKDSKASMEIMSQTPPLLSNEKEQSEKTEIPSSSKSPSPLAAVSTPVSVPGPAGVAAEKPKYELPEAPDTKSGPIQIETAPPSNWHESWGKVDDHHTQLTPEKISQGQPSQPSQPINPQIETQMPLPAEYSSVGPDNIKMPASVDTAAPATAPNSAPSPATLPSTIGGEEKSGEQPGVSPMSSKMDAVPQSMQPPGYSYVDDRPGVAHVTDIPPAGAAKMAGESKKPVVDFLRAMWKPSLKEPAPLQNLEMNQMPIAAAPVPDVMQIEATLQDSLLPSQREMAAEVLSKWDSRREPSVIPALLHSATDDPAGTVRAACVHCLVKMKANSPEVVSVLLRLKADPDLRVRREAHHALVSFGLAQPELENETVHQISAPGEIQ